MENNNWINSSTTIQVLLDAEAGISNAIHGIKIPTKASKDLEDVVKMLHVQIECLRGPISPPCYGQDDCSTTILSTCPWRMTCGS